VERGTVALLNKWRRAFPILLLLAALLGVGNKSWGMGITVAILSTVVWWIGYRGLRKEVDRQAAESSHAVAAAPLEATVQAVPEKSVGGAFVPAPDLPRRDIQQEIFQRLASVPRPRPVRLNRLVMLVAVAVLLVAAAFLFYAVDQFRPASFFPRAKSRWYPAVLLVAIPLGLLGLWRQAQREISYRRLLRDGEIALALVVGDWLVSTGKRKERKVRYQFQTTGGETLYDECFDYNDMYYKDMKMPVFYDPQTRQGIGIGGTYFEVVLPH
jgi:hypothetical protein